MSSKSGRTRRIPVAVVTPPGSKAARAFGYRYAHIASGFVDMNLSPLMLEQLGEAPEVEIAVRAVEFEFVHCFLAIELSVGGVLLFFGHVGIIFFLRTLALAALGRIVVFETLSEREMSAGAAVGVDIEGPATKWHEEGIL